jgi:hypothetical protein
MLSNDNALRKTMEDFDLPEKDLEDIKVQLEDIQFNIRYSLNEAEDKLSDVDVLDSVLFEVQKDRERDEMKFGGPSSEDENANTIDSFLKKNIDAMYKKSSEEDKKKDDK